MGPMWMIHRDGQQFGPADEETVRGWITEGRVAPDDLVWTEGMGQWLRLASVAAFANTPVAVSLDAPGVPGVSPVLRPGAVPPGPPQPTGTYPGSLGAFGSAGYIPEHLTRPPGAPVAAPGPAPTGYGYGYGYGSGPVRSAYGGGSGGAPQRPSTGMAMLLPVGRSGWSIGAGYCALIGIVFFPLAIVGLILGIVALRDITAHPHLMGKGRAVFAIVVGGLWAVLIVLFVIGRLARG